MRPRVLKKRIQCGAEKRELHGLILVLRQEYEGRMKARMVAGGETSNLFHTSLIMLVSQLNNDVILEIFLQFTAIDWDGPFTLMLVCSKWSNLVLSQPRVWTWIMVDDTQAEWRERIEAAAHLSKNLPLQIVLRVPFGSQASLSHITRRCTTLFLDSRFLEDYDVIPRSRSWAKTIASYEQFTEYSAELKQSNDSLAIFLRGVRIDDIQIRNEDQEHTSFAYSAWHVYERLNQGVSVPEVIKSGEAFIITALVFKHVESTSSPRIQVPITDLWRVLPLLSNLSYLELAENYIEVPENLILPHIHLRSLQTLKIDSPMMDSTFFSLENDVWLGLLSLLDTLTAPSLEDLSLRSPLHRIIAAMMNIYGRFHPLQLNISISVFDETLDQEHLDIHLVWHGLRRCTVDIPEQNNPRRHTDSEVVEALRLLFNRIPRHCSVQLNGDTILEPLMQSNLLRDVELHLITQIDDSGVIRKPLRWPRKIRSLSLTGMHSKGQNRVPWISSVEKLWSGVGSTIIYPNDPPIPIRALECASHTRFQPETDLIGEAIQCNPFTNLRDIECDYSLAVWMITNHKAPQLRSLTLLQYTGQYTPFSEVLDVAEKESHALLSLDTLGVPGMPEWHHLLPFVAKFNRTRGRGIYTIKLSDLPHPAMLHHLGEAFKGEAKPANIFLDLFEYQESEIKRRYPKVCPECSSSGWTCYGDEYCIKWCSLDMVEITADTPLTKYKGDWGPDGQGWEHDPSHAKGSEMDAEQESVGATSEMSVALNGFNVMR